MSSEQSTVAVKDASAPLLMGLQELGESQSVGDLAVIKEKTRKAPRTAFKPGKPPGPGRPKGVPNKLTIGLREAVELAVQPGQCHPQGFAGWLVDRAQGGIEDRKIFAGVVSRVIPLQVEKKTDTTMRIELGWLQGRDVGRHLSQPLPIAAQVIDIEHDSGGNARIKYPSDADAGASGAAAGGGDVPAQPAGEGEQG